MPMLVYALYTRYCICKFSLYMHVKEELSSPCTNIIFIIINISLFVYASKGGTLLTLYEY